MVLKIHYKISDKLLISKKAKSVFFCYSQLKCVPNTLIMFFVSIILLHEKTMSSKYFLESSHIQDALHSAHSTFARSCNVCHGISGRPFFSFVPSFCHSPVKQYRHIGKLKILLPFFSGNDYNHSNQIQHRCEKNSIF